MKFYKTFLADVYRHRALLFELAKKDFQSSYVGSAFGLFWYFVEPIIYVVIMWIFFTKVAKYTPSGGTPYIAWLMPALYFWYFLSGAINSTSSIFRSYAYLLRKWEFNMAILPVVGILAALFSHIVFLTLLMGIFVYYGVEFSFYWFQILYYFLATSFFVVGLAWITASLSLFMKDVRNIIGIFLQIAFWVSPIFWENASFPPAFQGIVRLNPIYHLVSGYRNSFLNKVPFWADMYSFTSFWVFSIFLWIVGAMVYKKLRPHFGELI